MDDLLKKLKSITTIVLVIFIGIFGIFSFGSLFEINDAGWYKVKQSWPAGKMSIKNDPGIFAQMFGKITPYQKTGEIFFSKSKADGGDDETTGPVNITFRDGSKADISGVMKYRLPSNPTQQLKLHTDFRGPQEVKMILIRNQLIEALLQSGPHFQAEEVYSARRSEFASLCGKQLTDGIYAVDVNEIQTFDADSNKFIDYQVKIRTKDGKPVLEKDSPLDEYGIEIISFAIKDIDFDSKIDSLISMKKEAEQKKVVAKANADKARQDAITEEEMGKARVAKSKADKDVEKIAAVTDAEKAFEVAKFDALKAIEEAKKIKAQGEAEALAARAKVSAGLTPQERAEWDYKTKVGIAAELAKMKFPDNWVVAGGDGKGSVNPFEAVGLQSFINIQKALSKSE